MQTIGLYKNNQCWMSRSTMNQDAFGVMDIATAFTVNADADYVLSRIQALNPDCRVILIHA